MKYIGFALLLVAFASPCLAQPAPAQCTSCVSAAGCAPARDTCAAECRARLFGIDPKRGECLASCLGTFTKCAEAAQTGCRDKGQCR